MTGPASGTPANVPSTPPSQAYPPPPAPGEVDDATHLPDLTTVSVDHQGERIDEPIVQHNDEPTTDLDEDVVSGAEGDLPPEPGTVSQAAEVDGGAGPAIGDPAMVFAATEVDVVKTDAGTGGSAVFATDAASPPAGGDVTGGQRS